jgi:hypothetical protein
MKDIKINEIFEHEGQKYLKIAEDRAVKVDRIKENGEPVIMTEAEEILHEDGRKDVKMHVPFFTLQGRSQL